MGGARERSAALAGHRGGLPRHGAYSRSAQRLIGQPGHRSRPAPAGGPGPGARRWPGSVHGNGTGSRHLRARNECRGHASATRTGGTAAPLHRAAALRNSQNHARAGPARPAMSGPAVRPARGRSARHPVEKIATRRLGGKRCGQRSHGVQALRMGGGVEVMAQQRQRAAGRGQVTPAQRWAQVGTRAHAATEIASASRKARGKASPLSQAGLNKRISGFAQRCAQPGLKRPRPPARWRPSRV